MTTTANPIVAWKIDPAHSSAEFKVKHMMISSVKGSFNGLNGTLIEDTSNPTLSHVAPQSTSARSALAMHSGMHTSRVRTSFITSSIRI